MTTDTETMVQIPFSRQIFNKLRVLGSDRAWFQPVGWRRLPKETERLLQSIPVGTKAKIVTTVGESRGKERAILTKMDAGFLLEDTHIRFAPPGSLHREQIQDGRSYLEKTDEKPIFWLQAEPNNPYDAYAMRLMVKVKSRPQGLFLGYLARDVSFVLEQMDYTFSEVKSVKRIKGGGLRAKLFFYTVSPKEILDVDRSEKE